MRRHVPNTITCCNLLSGCVAIVMAFYGSEWAIWFIVLGAVFDFFDGMVARLLGVQSPIGKELDSLADVVTFGVAPSTMLFTYLCQLSASLPSDTLSHILPFSAYLISAFSALRLAKFNLDDRQTSSFIGLPTPANALFWASLITVMNGQPSTNPFALYVVLVLILVSCWLLVVELPLFALKFKQWSWRGNEVRYIFLLSCVPILLFFGLPGIAVVIAWYVVLSVITNSKQKLSA